MDYLLLAVIVLVSIISTLAYDGQTIRNYRTAVRGVNSYNDDVFGRRTVVGPSRADCADLCYDAHCSGSRARVTGCVCSNFDFSGIRFGGGFDQRSSFANNCGCSTGTVCVRNSSGRRRCLRRRRRTNSSRPSYNSRPVNSGMPRRIGGRCGYLSPVCRASQRDFDQQVRFTYDESLRRCVRERVFSLCTAQGPRNNIFRNLGTCNRMCL